MLLRACKETGYLEALTGLDQLYDEGDRALESVDWDEEGEGEVMSGARDMGVYSCSLQLGMAFDCCNFLLTVMIDHIICIADPVFDIYRVLVRDTPVGEQHID